MRNSPALPLASLVLAILLGIHASAAAAGDGGPLNELQLGEFALALALLVFGLQGIISILIEGQELVPGRVPARLTNPLSVAIVIFSLLLFALAVLLAYGIADGWRLQVIGTLAGVGCLVLALLLVLYKEAFIGDEANFDDRQDGIPW